MAASMGPALNGMTDEPKHETNFESEFVIEGNDPCGEEGVEAAKDKVVADLAARGEVVDRDSIIIDTSACERLIAEPVVRRFRRRLGRKIPFHEGTITRRRLQANGTNSTEEVPYNNVPFTVSISQPSANMASIIRRAVIHSGLSDNAEVATVKASDTAISARNSMVTTLYKNYMYFFCYLLKSLIFCKTNDNFSIIH